MPIRVQGKEHMIKQKSKAAADLSLKEQEMLAIIAVLERNKGHREKTARELGISRRTLQYKLKKLKLE